MPAQAPRARLHNAYRWATDIKPAIVEAIAAAPGNRMIVAGEALTATTEFGGVSVPTQALFIAALAGGPARVPSPLLAIPAITSAVLDQVPDGQIRQGDTGTLVIRGAALDQVTSAKLGDIDAHIRPGTATADELRLAIMIPHGHPPGPLALALGNAAGVAERAEILTVTPIVVGPRGRDDGRGTFASPMRLCRSAGYGFARYGDVVLLQQGTHECNDSVYGAGGVTFRGASKSGTIVGGVRGANDRFAGFSTLAENVDIGELAIAAANVVSDGMTVTIDGIEISGSPVGISYQADVSTDRFSLHGARVQTTEGGVGLSGPFTADLGTAAVPGNNRLDVASGEPALIDGRITAGPAIDAHGTTLNGLDFSGDVVGPVTTAGYVIGGPNTIRF